VASTEAQVSLNAASAAGPGTTVDFTAAKRNVTAVFVPSASLTSGVVLVEASQDGINWVVVRTTEMAGRANFAIHLQGVAFRYWRANVARTVGGGTLRATFMEAD
jgi:uncharacterized protein YqfA (UPF0365 family)